MVTTPQMSTPVRSGTATPAEDAKGYLLLTIQHAVVHQVYDGQRMVLAKGEMKLECISLPIPPEVGKQTANPFAPSPNDPLIPTHDFWLVLLVGPTFEMPLMPQQPLLPVEAASGVAYAVDSPAIPNARLELTLPSPGSAADLEDLDSFEVLLRQYGSLGKDVTALKYVTAPMIGSAPKPAADSVGTVEARGGVDTAPLPEEMRGKLVLVNEDNGEVVGELDQAIDIEDDKRIAQDSKDKPVVLDFGNVMTGYAPKVKIQTVPEDELDDWMLRSAHEISKGILTVSSWSQKGMNWGAQKFIANTKAAEKDVELSPRAKAGFRMAHNASVKTVTVTKSTVGMINNAISHVAEKTYTKVVEPGYKNVSDTFSPSPSRRGSMGPKQPPPIPARKPLLNTNVVTSPVSISPDSPVGTRRAPPPVPGRTASPLSAPSPQSARSPSGKRADLSSRMEELMTKEYSASDEKHDDALDREEETAFVNTRRPSTPRNKRPFLNRLLLAGEVVLTSLEATAHDLIDTGTAAASSAAGHKYGAQAGHATALAGGAVRNVAVVYIDVRGVGRKALLKGTAKGFVKARMKDGETVRLQGEGREVAVGDAGEVVEAGQVEETNDGYVVGMSEVGGNRVTDAKKRQ